MYAARVITVSPFYADMEVCDLAPLVKGAVLRSVWRGVKGRFVSAVWKADLVLVATQFLKYLCLFDGQRTC